MSCVVFYSHLFICGLFGATSANELCRTYYCLEWPTRCHFFFSKPALAITKKQKKKKKSGKKKFQWPQWFPDNWNFCKLKKRIRIFPCRGYFFDLHVLRSCISPLLFDWIFSAVIVQLYYLIGCPQQLSFNTIIWLDVLRSCLLTLLFNWMPISDICTRWTLTCPPPTPFCPHPLQATSVIWEVVPRTTGSTWAINTLTPNGPSIPLVRRLYIAKAKVVIICCNWTQDAI